MVISKGSTTSDPTTVRLANPDFTGFAVLLTLYSPELILLEALKLVDSGINAVVSRPPPATPSLKVNSEDPLELKLIGLGSLPLVPI